MFPYLVNISDGDKIPIDMFFWDGDMVIKEVFSEKSCFKNFAHPLSEEENI